MKTFPKTIFAAFLAVATSGQTVAAGSDIITGIHGTGGRYVVEDHGNGRIILDGVGDVQNADIFKTGNGKLDIFMSGPASDLTLLDESRHGLNKVYTGICPPGGKTRPQHLTQGGGIHILRCE